MEWRNYRECFPFNGSSLMGTMWHESRLVGHFTWWLNKKIEINITSKDSFNSLLDVSSLAKIWSFFCVRFDILKWVFDYFRYLLIFHRFLSSLCEIFIWVFLIWPKFGAFCVFDCIFYGCLLKKWDLQEFHTSILG